MRRLLGLLILLPLLAGCFAPGPPRIEASQETEEAFRVPLPVPTDPSGGWALVNRHLGVIGQGRVVARVDEDGKLLWRTTLPDQFALTGRPGRTHAAATPIDGPVLLVGAAASGRFPSMAKIDPVSGRVTRLAPPPARTPGKLRFVKVLSSSGLPFQAVAATCLTGSSCTVTAWDASTGKVLWKYRTRGPAVFAAPCDQGKQAKGPAFTQNCEVLAFVADGRLVTLLRGADRPHARPIEPSRGGVAEVIPTRYRVLVLSAPHGPDCRARAASYDLTDQPTGSAPAWQRAFTWDQPQASVREGCRRDPSIPLLVGYRLTLPDSAGALVGDDYHGTFPLRLKPGEYPVAVGAEIFAHRADGSYRDPRTRPSGHPRIRPEELTADARELGQGAWYVPGRGRKGEIIAVDVYGKITWRRTSNGTPFFLSSNRLVYAEGSHLVALRASD
ncbi:PQQ-binding-like beta-propeller repeat protein [Streptomyces sp. NPDC005775]|uniref:outer membrane protein assembly factor BamB family protein n=1 Tax=Streptomyces sp. NPDC005775 TaxID=3364729 RepID=UPI00367BA196